MARPRTGKAYEVLNCRVPKGLTTRISEHAELHGLRVREVVAQALLTHLDGTPIAPLPTQAEQVVATATQQLTQVVKMLKSVHASKRTRSTPARDTALASEAQPQDPPVEGGTLDAISARIDALCSQSLSDRKIADQLNAEGIPTPTGKGKWHHPAVARERRKPTTEGMVSPS